jgi:cation diffusion facilitator family transporter
VVIGIVMVQLTGWLVLDPLIAFLVAANIVWTGVRLLRDTAQGLLDRALPPEEMKKISGVLSRYEEKDIRFHALRTWAAGQRRFVSMHVLVPGRWTVQRGHDLSEKLESELVEVLRGNTTFFIHIEPSEDPGPRLLRRPEPGPRTPRRSLIASEQHRTRRGRTLWGSAL